MYIDVVVAIANHDNNRINKVSIKVTVYFCLAFSLIELGVYVQSPGMRLDYYVVSAASANHKQCSVDHTNTANDDRF